MSERPLTSSTDDHSKLEVGRIGRPHGLRGEVVVQAITNRPDRFVPGAVFDANGREMRVASCRPHQGRWLVCFEGVADRTAAEALRGVLLTASPPATSPEGELWVHELVGAEVVDASGDVLGRVESVEANPASDLLVLGKGKLIPLRFAIDVQPGRIVVDLPAGLLEAQR